MDSLEMASGGVVNSRAPAPEEDVQNHAISAVDDPALTDAAARAATEDVGVVPRDTE